MADAASAPAPADAPAAAMDVEEPQRLFLLDLPYECLVEIFLLLDAAEICAAARCSKEARAVAAAEAIPVEVTNGRLPLVG